MKLTFKSKLAVPLFIIMATIVSTGCGMMGGLTLADGPGDLLLSSSGNKTGYEARTLAARDPNADDAALYGIWRQ